MKASPLIKIELESVAAVDAEVGWSMVTHPALTLPKFSMGGESSPPGAQAVRVRAIASRIDGGTNWVMVHILFLFLSVWTGQRSNGPATK
jgi:hypothetical protein